MVGLQLLPEAALIHKRTVVSDKTRYWAVVQKCEPADTCAFTELHIRTVTVYDWLPRLNFCWHGQRLDDWRRLLLNILFDRM